MGKVDKSRYPRTEEEVYKKTLMAEAKMLLVLKKIFPNAAEDLDKAFDEYVEVSNRLKAEHGGEFSLVYVVAAIPDNTYVMLLEEMAMTVKSEIDQSTDNVGGDVNKTLGKIGSN